MTPKEKQKQILIDIMEADAKDGLYKQQTAVQSLFDELNKHKLLVKPYTKGVNSLFEKAIQMEKEQIVNANDVGFEEGHKHTKSNYTFFPKDGLDYYNETYKK